MSVTLTKSEDVTDSLTGQSSMKESTKCQDSLPEISPGCNKSGEIANSEGLSPAACIGQLRMLPVPTACTLLSHLAYND